MIRFLLLTFLAVPGSGVLLLLVLRSLVNRVRAEREADEDSARAKRFALDNGIPEEFVSVPKGRRRVPRPEPEMTSRYDREVSR